ncbi:MAG: hypothetical protein PHG16_08260 [Lachnospiraceae bacterium]|nr:hypothetical protein [Lachnospiraceae bacterium]
MGGEASIYAYPLSARRRTGRICCCRRDSLADYVQKVCSSQTLWGEDLSLIPGFAATVMQDMQLIQEHGASALMEHCLN